MSFFAFGNYDFPLFDAQKVEQKGRIAPNAPRGQ
jgi:hypothetical protein